MKTCQLFVLVCLSSLVTSCITTNRSYWVRSQLGSGQNVDHWAIKPDEIDQLNPKDKRPFKSVINNAEFDGYYQNLRVIEYDDYGDKWDRRQSQNAVDLIKALPENNTIVVFAHGWKNNAKPNNHDLHGFNKFMIELSSQEHSSNAIGIYLGWRGASIKQDYSVEALQKLSQIPATLSFMERRLATERVAGIPLEDDLWKIRSAALERNSRVILVGHSFGGRIMERVASPSIIAARSIKKGVPQAQKIRKKLQIADLVVLINPASEGLHARQMKLSLKDWPEEDPPVIISFRSENDDATGWIWQVGKKFDRLLTPLPLQDRTYLLGHHRAPYKPTDMEKQSKYLNNTAGKVESLIVSHFHQVSDKPFSWEVEKANSNEIGLSASAYCVFTIDQNILNKHGGENQKGGIFNRKMTDIVTRMVKDTASRDAYKQSNLQKVIMEYNRNGDAAKQAH